MSVNLKNGQEESDNHFLIPANVSTKFEIFEGFGWAEAKYVIVALIIGAALYYFSGFITKTESFNVNDASVSQTVGLKEDANTSIDGDIVTKKIIVIPMIVRFLFIVIPVTGTYFTVRRDPATGMSLVTNIKCASAYNKKQKRYLFKYDSGTEVH